MKTFQTIAEESAHIVLIFVLTLVVVATGFLFQTGSGRLAAATVVKGGDQTIAAWDSLAVADLVLDEAAVSISPLPLENVDELAERKSSPPAASAEKPDASDRARVLGSGEASFYGREFAGRSTASGETFDPAALTAAHRTLPFGSKVRVTNSHNGRSVVVRINDRGPFVDDRLIDVSSGAARQLGMVQSGTARVMLELL